MTDNNNETKIIRTFKGEVIFLISFAVFLAGILGAYYSLVKDVAVLRNEQKHQTALLIEHTDEMDRIVAEYKGDHDLLVRIREKLGI